MWDRHGLTTLTGVSTGKTNYNPTVKEKSSPTNLTTGAMLDRHGLTTLTKLSTGKQITIQLLKRNPSPINLTTGSICRIGMVWQSGVSTDKLQSNCQREIPLQIRQ